jgi:hypothetical protein
MDKLSLILVLMTGPTLIGGFLIAAVSLGYYSWTVIALCVAAGLLLTWPAALVISRRIKRRDPAWNERKSEPKEELS